MAPFSIKVLSVLDNISISTTIKSMKLQVQHSLQNCCLIFSCYGYPQNKIVDEAGRNLIGQIFLETQRSIHCKEESFIG